MEYPHFNPHPSCASRLLPSQSYVFNVAYGVGKAGGARPWPSSLPLQCLFLLLFLSIVMLVSSSFSCHCNACFFFSFFPCLSSSSLGWCLFLLCSRLRFPRPPVGRYPPFSRCLPPPYLLPSFRVFPLSLYSFPFSFP